MATVHDADTGMLVRRCSCDSCFYCDVLLAPRHEHDHCHEWKDRTPLAAWPLNMQGDGLGAVLNSIRNWSHLSEYPRPSEIIEAAGNYETHWSVWSPAARLYYAKLTVVAAREDLMRRIQLARSILGAGLCSPDEVAEDVGIQTAIAHQIAESGDFTGFDIRGPWRRVVARAIERDTGALDRGGISPHGR